MARVITHYVPHAGLATACGWVGMEHTTNNRADTTCKRCQASFAPKRVGTSGGRGVYEVVCVGGPWSGETVVLREQPDASLSLRIRVGTSVGRYNMNNGHWVPQENAV